MLCLCDIMRYVYSSLFLFLFVRISSYSFGRSPLWILRFFLGVVVWRSYVTLYSFLFPLCVVFVYCGLFRSYFSFVLGFVASFHLLPYCVVCSSVGTDRTWRNVSRKQCAAGGIPTSTRTSNFVHI
jgi:hypothetical protein